VKPKKHLGQHWLLDEPTLARVAAAGQVGPDDTVLEIGPGLGNLTAVLAALAKRVVAVETDSELVAKLVGQVPAHVEVIEGDIMAYDLTQLPAGYKVVANIPYYLTSNLLRMLLENPNPPSRLALLVQKEVAERVTAPAGQMSVLAFSVQYYGQPKIVGLVSKELFQPPPKVDSAILQIIRYDKPVFVAEPAKLFRLVKAGFGEKRKQLKNSLAGGLQLEAPAASEILEAADIDPTARAQELSLAQWQKLYQVIYGG
jgi:16S rRNA (adenine1518-N6/adenine1519-N6)-dimethyltransferase